ncbi:MAG: MBL fold metallo-hydrolase [Candidatus Izimaplasma sp.]|nr:MBL fold metallo-hydrolase [Candidatus Izimaplasma bacterium]
MKIITLEKDVLVYQFEPENGGFLGLNIFVIINELECTIIDTGFRRHFLQVQKDLEEKGIVITNVILTHFHPDHIGGLPRVKEATIFGSIFAQYTLKKYVEDYQNYLPNITVVDKKKIEFGRHKFLLEINSGHSKDGLLITLNDKYVFVGDDIICDNEGAPSIPYCSEKNPEANINSIKKIIAKLGNTIILPTHGLPMEGEDRIMKDLISRLTYLHYISEFRNASYEDFFKETNVSFLGRDWHVLNQIEEVE